ncbi:hypothetical protein BKA64DRAFT_777516 [Cadophora sp. MPI-SDFR-AT-0126]|nr:hypothetical protein BKA64DRAFT_777516 [Leotiomycetes sp. MPI-SDFR-AT-0126]
MEEKFKSTPSRHPGRLRSSKLSETCKDLNTSAMAGPRQKTLNATPDIRSSSTMAAEQTIKAPAVTDPPSLLADVLVDFENFTLFPKLAAEIRLKIWRTALSNTSNIIKVDLEPIPDFVTEQVAEDRRGRRDQLRGVTRDVYRIKCNFDLKSKDGPNGALLGVCVESRTEALKILTHYDYIQSRDPSPSKKLWFNLDTDIFYFDQRAILALTIMNDFHPLLSTVLHNGRKVNKIGVDEFSVGTMGVNILLVLVFSAARDIVPIEAINGNHGEDASMNEHEHSRLFQELIITSFVEKFRAMVEQHSQYDERSWGSALYRACNEMGCMRHLLDKSTWVEDSGTRYQVSQKLVYK